MELLTVKETAQILRVSQITVRRYIASGRLSAERVGHGIRVRREAIEDFVTPVVVEQARQEQFYWPYRPPNYAEDDLVEMHSRSSPSGVVWVLVDRLDEYLDEHVKDGNPFGDIVGIGESEDSNDVASNKHKYVADAILASSSDDLIDDTEDSDELPILRESLGNIIGIGRSGSPSDVSANKYDYLAEAYESDKG